MKNISVEDDTKARFDSVQRNLAALLNKKMNATDTIEYLIDVLDPESYFAVYDKEKELKKNE